VPSDADLARWRDLAASRLAIPRTEHLIEWCEQAQAAITELLAEREAMRAVVEAACAGIDGDGDMGALVEAVDAYRAMKEGSRG